jgi:OmpA-OmpF porin, OOP family
MKTPLTLLAVGTLFPTLCGASASPIPQSPAAAARDAAAGIDLLDFDQGTVLVSAPESYGSGVSAWSPFRISDGSRKDVWCSAQGQTAGAEFVYELDQDAEPRSFRVVTTGAQESGYPGISARSVSLWGAGASGAFEKLGSLEVPKGGEKELALTSAQPIRRVKLVVESNWGHAGYTELMEADLIGRKIGTPPVVDVSGEYYSKQWNGLRTSRRAAWPRTPGRWRGPRPASPGDAHGRGTAE